MATSKQKYRKNADPYPGEPKINEEKLEKYVRGDAAKSVDKSRFHKKLLQKTEAVNRFSTKQAARSELLLPEEHGYIEADEGESTFSYRQKDIADSVDIASATKYFDLRLKFGHYYMDYTRNGRQLVLGGKKGHVAAIDWITKKLLCEINVMESVHSIKWLHMHSMFATAQKNHLYIYDNQGVELHCLKNLYRIINMEFLPYHFLLNTASDEGYLSWLDISVGKMVSQFNSKMGYMNVMCQNPYNAITVTGHSNGTVAMWSPNVREPLVKMLCSPKAIKAVQIDANGKYMATASIDGFLNLWDVRMLKASHSYKLSHGANKLSFSQRGLLAASLGNVVQIYKDCLQTDAMPYLSHRVRGSITDMKFCPFEDVLGLSHSSGFTSIICPGAGEPNFDAFESNPFMTKSQRREMEVKALLDKIQPELICLDPAKLGKVDVPSLQTKLKEKEDLIHIKAPKIDVELKHKTKGKSGSGKKFKRKKMVKEQAKTDYVKKTLKRKNVAEKVKTPISGEKKQAIKESVLDRFKK